MTIRILPGLFGLTTWRHWGPQVLRKRIIFVVWRIRIASASMDVQAERSYCAIEVSIQHKFRAAYVFKDLFTSLPFCSSQRSLPQHWKCVGTKWKLRLPLIAFVYNRTEYPYVLGAVRLFPHKMWGQNPSHVTKFSLAKYGEAVISLSLTRIKRIGFRFSRSREHQSFRQLTGNSPDSSPMNDLKWHIF